MLCYYQQKCDLDSLCKQLAHYLKTSISQAELHSQSRYINGKHVCNSLRVTRDVRHAVCNRLLWFEFSAAVDCHGTSPSTLVTSVYLFV